IVDMDGRIIAILAGCPDDANWDQVQRNATALLEETKCCCRPPTKSFHHCRGAFTTLRCGFSHGGGQTHPQNLANSKTNMWLIQALNARMPIKRVVGFGSSIFESWAPQVHAYYVEKLGALQRHDRMLKRPFRNSVFPSTTYNLGPQTICYPHVDSANLPFGFCAIMALGSYDPKKGGHLVLWECSLVVEFPPGSTVLIPSSILTHSNTPVSKSETRYSMMQYAAGGLFCWVDHEFQKMTTFRKSRTAAQLAALDRHNSNCWSFRLSLFRCLPSVSTAS
ncbi:hypothetical protein CPB84DRAFT_1672179, partial [Gymnopilus junonius]